MYRLHCRGPEQRRHDRRIRGRGGGLDHRRIACGSRQLRYPVEERGHAGGAHRIAGRRDAVGIVEDAQLLRVANHGLGIGGVEAARGDLGGRIDPHHRTVIIGDEVERLGDLRRDGRPVPAYYSYDLPGDWQIVP